MLEREYQHYKSILKDILKDHHGEYVVIVGEEVKGYFPTLEGAYTYGQANNYEVGDFLVQQVLTDDESTSIYHSRVFIS